MNMKTLLLAATATFALAAPANAHNPWLKPSITVLSDTTQSVTVDAASSTIPFQANHAAMPVDNVQVVKPDGSAGAVENVARGRYRSTFDVKIDMPGTWRVGTSNSGVMGTFKLNGEDWRVGPRRGPAAGATNIVANISEISAAATDLNLTENHSRNEFFVTAGTPTDGVFTPTGKGLEFVAITSPTDLVTGEPGHFRFTVDGKPAAGLKVDVIADGQRYREEALSQELTTNAEGVVAIEWPVAGFYWISTSTEDGNPSEPRASKRRMTHIVTLEVVAP